MEIIRGLHNITARHKGCVLTIGTFDGLHHGHQMLLSHLKAKSEELNCPNLLVTFEPQPREYFQGAVMPARLTRFREKVTILRGLDLDRLLCIPFNERTRIIPAKDVIEGLLVDTLDVQYVVVGDDFQFGEGARGNYDTLREAGDHFGFGVSHMGTLKFEHGRISSSRIRDALSSGDFELTEKLLGRPYFIMGRVVYGRQLGRQLGVPTANIRLQRYRAALEGVFAVTVIGLDRQYEGIANIGVRPTVDGKEPLLEVHIFDFDEDIYGRLLTVTFLRKVRDERTFDGLDSLKTQIEQDISETREWFATRRLKRDSDSAI
ncbi:MAG TPA: bifunctional riboflavin kinase/FAD synthetase [Gammaproteobacteria bacterium]|uniref:Bifunctional riboflavin kinase/FMN adenylyltransferase n=1 Tax=marine metagenome TaxID=408172 RepID=A0A381PCY1_9ZZZZ|nr:bifunctional riboflavin kinase/FAD synthetase [Gammaproteobacteria bacterium]|tara:strand:+ start:75 stop:1031 length:957 start_codon:yes stop_codon:yes gene_type:complete